MKAFPRQINFFNGISEGKWIDDGMDLRDYFAAQALQAIIIREGKNALRVDDLTFTAYQYADGMMKEREAK